MIRPTFMSFETAKKALNASQLGLDTVGHNLANINTTGYTRQRVDQVSVASGGYKYKYYSFGPQLPGQGSEVIGINQVRDTYLDKRYRSEASTCGKYSAISNDLEEIGKIFDEIITTGSHQLMSDFLSALDKLILEADSKEYATVLRNQAEQLAQMLNRDYTALDGVETRIRDELGAAVTDVNSILEQIAALNQKIKEDNFYGNPSNELNDQRNLLIDQLSELMDISVERIPYEVSKGFYIEQIKITINGTGSVNQNIDPITLVDGGEYYGIYTETDEITGEVSVKYCDGMSGMDINVHHKDGTKSNDITQYLYNGAIKGHLNVLNGKGTYATNGENGFRGIPYYREALNEYATNLATQMNKLNELAVYCPNGVYLDANGDPVTIKRDLFTSSDGGPITAANICVTDEWLKNPMYLENASKNNALFVDEAGWLHFPDEDDPDNPIRTRIKISDVAGVDKDGRLLDHNGKFLDENGIPTNDVEKAVNIEDLQRAITEHTTYYPFDINNYLAQPKYAADGTTITNTPELGLICVKNGKNSYFTADALVPPYTVDDIQIDDDGYLFYYNGPTKTYVTYTDTSTNPSTSNLKVKQSDLYQTVTGKGTDYIVGQPTPNTLLPGDAESDNLLRIKIMLRDTNFAYGNGSTCTFQEYLVNMQSDLGLDKNLSDTQLNAAVTVLLGLADSRDAISGVSADEEAINMMTFQNYYNAAARYMTVLDEALGTIIQGMGVVGR